MLDLTTAPHPQPLPTRGRGGAWYRRFTFCPADHPAWRLDASGGDIFSSMKAGAGRCG